MARSMNGRALPLDSPEMQAFVAYIKFLSSGVPAGKALSGLGTGSMPELDRAADPVRGKAIYANACLSCHNEDGSGIRRSLPSVDLGYMVPPLWGPDSFNDGAGMARLINAANFVHFNMPHGVDYLDPRLSVADAWDVAAYVVSQPRPHKAGSDKDFPDLLLKPVDAPFGPYADKFSEKVHKYGPFAAIREAIASVFENLRDDMDMLADFKERLPPVIRDDWDFVARERLADEEALDLWRAIGDAGLPKEGGPEAEKEPGGL